MTKIMGILNITPDSFSDGGRYFDKQKAISKAQSLIDDGVDIIDIGAESTRPGADIVPLHEEFARLKNVLPDIINIAHKNGALVSIDSYKPEIIKFALENNVDIVNDQKGLENQEKILLLKYYKKPVILMHSLTIPTDRNINLPEGIDIIETLQTWIDKKIESLVNYGIPQEQIIFDVGLGFGKTFSQCCEIIKRVRELVSFSVKTCIGHSKKGFLGALGCQKIFTLATSAILMANGIHFLRVHDVLEHKILQRNFF